MDACIGHDRAGRNRIRIFFDEVFDGFSRIVIQVITSSYAFPASINANYILAAVPDGLTDPQSNFANNLLASSCDSRRPTIAFATRHSVFTTTSRDADMAGDEPAHAGAGRLDKGNKLADSRTVHKHK